MAENQRRPVRRRRRVHKTRVVGCFVVLLLIIILISALISGCVKKMGSKDKKPDKNKTSVTDIKQPEVTDTAEPVVKEHGRYVVCLDPGHGGSDPGSDYGDMTRLEKTDNLKYAAEVREALKKYPDIEVVMTRETDEYVGNEERAEISNNSGADLHIALHRNMFKDSTAYGVEVWVKNAHDMIDDVCSFKILTKLQQVGIQQSRGMKNGHPQNDDYEIVKFTNANCITIELGYITNDEDNRLFDLHYKEYAQAIADAIAETCTEQIEPVKYPSAD